MNYDWIICSQPKGTTADRKRGGWFNRAQTWAELVLKRPLAATLKLRAQHIMAMPKPGGEGSHFWYDSAMELAQLVQWGMWHEARKYALTI